MDSRVFHNFIFFIELLAKTLQRFGICLAVNNRLYRKLVSPVPIMFYDNLMFMIELHQLHFLPYPLIYPAQNLITWGLNCDIQSFSNNTKKHHRTHLRYCYISLQDTQDSFLTFSIMKNVAVFATRSWFPVKLVFCDTFLLVPRDFCLLRTITIRL